MQKIGITGNIGSGKSMVCKIFNTLKIPVFYADIEARMLYYNEDIKKAVKEAFGEKVFTQDEVDTKALAGVIFSNKMALKKINNIVHPAVLKRYNEWLSMHESAPYTIHETAVLFENNLQDQFDKTICIIAPKEVRLKRVMNRDGLSAEAIESRMKHQWPEKKKMALANFVINNDGKQFLIPQIMEIHHQIIKDKK